MLEWTGERYLPYLDPKIGGAEIHYEHLHRYSFAMRFAQSKAVLDLACGEGYGSVMLSLVASHVVGIDIDPNCIIEASKKYPKENLEFIQGSILEIPIEGENLFDLIICFEALEHVPNHEKLFSEVKRLLKDQGLFVVSTPNKTTYSDEEAYVNPFHVKELYFDQFRNVLRDYFKNVYYFGQRVFAGSNIWRLSPNDRSYEEFAVSKDRAEFTLRDDLKKIPRYFIALASNGELSRIINNSMLLDVSNALFLTQAEKIEEAKIHLKSNSDSLGLIYFAALREQERIIDSLKVRADEASQLQAKLYAMEGSIIWRSVVLFDNLIIEGLFPPKTRRRALYYRGLSRLKSIRLKSNKSLNIDPDGFLSRNEINRHRSNFVTEKLRTFEAGTIDKKVSIIIPTKNAGNDFEFVLEKLRSQKGISDLEIIVIDSGSADNTIDIAKRFECRIYNIDPSEFRHGPTRNFAAERANGYYIGFLVQDAMPIGDYWLKNTIRVLEDDDQIGAVTCRQVPRSEADLFAVYSLWSHNRFLGFTEDRIAAPDQMRPDLQPAEIRRLVGLDNVSSITRKDLFDELKFSDISYGEDLDLGRRILQRGYKIGFIFSTCVAHSHNRDPGYFIRRSYVDNKFLPKILSYDASIIINKDNNPNEIVASILILYYALNATIPSLSASLLESENIYHMFLKMKLTLIENLPRGYSYLEGFKKGDPSLDAQLAEICKIIKPSGNYPDHNLTKYYFDLFYGLAEFLSYYGFGNKNCDQVVDCLYKMFSMSAGYALANCYELNPASTINLDRYLSRGI